MTEKRLGTTKTELLADIERNWTALNAALNQLTEAQMTTQPDAQGWTVKDHLIHMTRWELSVVAFLQGRPRHQALGVAETLYRRGSDDAINAVIHQETSAQPLRPALEQFQATHQRLLQLLEPLTDADLQKPYRAYLPEEPDASEAPALNVIYGNTANHFAEHRGWIEALTQPAK